MKELTHEVTETYAWEANDGSIFYDKNECLQYEKTARCAILSRLWELVVGKDDPKTNGYLDEDAVFGDFVHGSSDYRMAVLRIKNEDDLYAVNQYAAMVGAPSVPSDMVHKLVLVGFGYEDDDLCLYGAYGQLVQQFADNMKRVFGLNEEENAE